jgi:hypothetical protein
MRTFSQHLLFLFALGVAVLTNPVLLKSAYTGIVQAQWYDDCGCCSDDECASTYCEPLPDDYGCCYVDEQGNCTEDTGCQNYCQGTIGS